MKEHPLPARTIATAAELCALCADLREAGLFGFDTEFIAERTYRARICLVQVATDREVVLIDPLPSLDLGPFWELVLDPALRVVTHAGQADYQLCYDTTGRVPERGFDCQLAAGFLGLGYPASYGSLVEKLCGRRLKKHETFTDWSRRPLRPEQVDYAVEDVAYLLPMYRELDGRLEQRDRREWVEEEFASRQRAVVRRLEAEEPFRAVSGAGKLNAGGLAVLRELHQWRERTAAERDRPTRTILGDPFLVELARRRPHDEREVAQVRGLHGRIRKEDMRDLLDVIRRGEAVPRNERPQPYDARAMPGDFLPVVDIARAVLRQVAVETGIASELLATRNDLERFVLAFYREPETLAANTLARGWREACVGDALRRLLGGEAHIRLRPAEGRPEIEIEGTRPANPDPSESQPLRR